MSQQPPAPNPPPPPPSAPPPAPLPQPYGQAPFAYPSVPYYLQPARPNNGIGTAGGVVGIVAAALFWIPFVSGIMGIVAVSLGGVGLNRANQLGGASKGMAITGIVCGGVVIALNILLIIGLSTTHGIVTP